MLQQEVSDGLAPFVQVSAAGQAGNMFPTRMQPRAGGGGMLTRAEISRSWGLVQGRRIISHGLWQSDSPLRGHPKPSYSILGAGMILRNAAVFGR